MSPVRRHAGAVQSRTACRREPQVLDVEEGVEPSMPPLLSTVMLPSAFGVTVKVLRAPENTAVSTAVASAAAVLMSRTATRLPGSTRPAKTACWRVIPVVPGPEGAAVGIALFSIRSVRADLGGRVGRVGAEADPHVR